MHARSAHTWTCKGLNPQAEQLGPLLGATFMFYLIDLSSGITDAYMLIAGAALVILTLFAPAGLLGELRRRALPWLP